MAMDGTMLHAHVHQAGEHQASEDHFGIGHMDLNDTSDVGLVAAGGISMGKGLGKAGDHKSGEHSFDHFANGGMAMGGSNDGALFSVGGVKMGHEKHHMQGKHGDKRFEDHFAGGMALNDEDKEGIGLTGSHGETMNHLHHARGPQDHFAGGSFVASGEIGLSEADKKVIKKNKHFVSFYS